MNKKIIMITGLLLLMAVFTTGCIDGQVDVNIKGDGSAEITYAMVVDKRTYDPELLEDFLQRLEDGMFVVEKRDMGELILINARVYLPRFRTIFDPLVAYDEEISRIPISFDKNWLRTRYLFDFTYDMDKAIAFIEKELGIEGAELDGMAFSVRLPNADAEGNADRVENDGRTFIWEINTTGTTDIYLQTNTINQINMIITIGVPLMAVIAFLNDRRKKNKEKNRL